MRRVLWVVGVVTVVVVLSGCVVRVSTDPFTNPTSQHRTQVEPDTFSFGSTIVSVFQSGRFFDGGASDIGWATSTDGGSSWEHGFLPGLTKYQGGGTLDRVSDPAVAYDARHHVWLVNSLGISDTSRSQPVLVSRSTDGAHTWGASPVTVASATILDKNWIVCDDVATSPYYGRCYVEYDDVVAGDVVHMATSADGGLSWTPATVGTANGLGGQPVVQPSGKVIVPYLSVAGTIAAIASSNGGTTYGAPVTVASITAHVAAGNLRTEPLPSAELDAAGKVYVVWQDCRFRASCARNDIVMSTSVDGSSWTAVSRVPIDVTNSHVDHFIPGLAVDKTTSGSSAHLGLAYYYYPDANCTSSTCQLDIGFISSANGGTSWSSPQRLAGPMSLGWLANTNQGVMVGDYISTSFTGANAVPAFAIAGKPGYGVFDEAIHAVSGGLAVSGGDVSSSTDRPVISGATRSVAPPFLTRF